MSETPSEPVALADELLALYEARWHDREHVQAIMDAITREMSAVARAGWALGMRDFPKIPLPLIKDA